MELWFMFLHAATDVAIKNEPDEMYLSRMCGDQVASKRSWCTSLGSGFGRAWLEQQCTPLVGDTGRRCFDDA